MSSTTPSASQSTYIPTADRPAAVLLDPTPSNIQKATSIISHAFTATPLMITFISELDGLTPSSPRPDSITQPRREAHFIEGITRVAQSGAIMSQAGDWSAVSIWEPPNFQGEDFASNRPQWGPMSRAWTQLMKQSRARHLGTPAQRDPAVVAAVTERTVLDLRRFWHLSFLVRNDYPDVAVVPGAVSSVVLPYLVRAREEGLPAWLEATTARAVGMYENWGFRVVDTFRFGEGQYAADGWPQEGGEGVQMWCMIYDDHLREGAGN